MSRRATCPACGFVHAADDAIAVGRFAPNPTYRAATAPTPARQTRAEAEADECRWRQTREPAPVPPSAPRPAPTVQNERAPEPEPEPFPALLMESAARAKAWRDFLVNVRFSLAVWQIDPEVRAGEHVMAWLARCREDLAAITGERR